MNLQEMMSLPEPRELLSAMKDFARKDKSFRCKYHNMLRQFESRIVDEERRIEVMAEAHSDFLMGQAMLSHHDPYVFYDDDAW